MLHYWGILKVKKQFFRLVLLVALFIQPLGGMVQAQKVEKLSYKVQARPLKDSVLLRWVPVDYQSWLIGNKYGYVVWRGTVLRDGKFVDTEPGKILTQGPLKPQPLNNWEAAADRDEYAAVAAQALYGEEFLVETNETPGIAEIYQKEKEQTLRFSFALMAADMSVEAAKLSGLWFTDEDVKPNETYLYRIWPAYQPEGTKTDTAFVYTGPSEYVPLPSPINLTATPGDKVVNLQWDNQLQSSFYNAFFVERSDDGGNKFKRITDTPLINTTPEGQDELPYAYYMDSLMVNDKSYYYRVIGISPFGELSPPSDTIEVVGFNKISYAPQIIKSEVIDNKEVELTWEVNEKDITKIEGYKVLRSTELNGKYEIVRDSLSQIYRKYVDKKPISTAYYRIQPYNRSGLGPASQGSLVQLKDSIPPEPPTGIIATADTTGVVQLSWKANTEADIYGYRVYRANGLNEEFSQITSAPIKENHLQDKIAVKTLTKYVYYKIMAVDQRQNFSKFSEVYALQRPDIVPPAPPAIRLIKPVKKGVYLKMVKSSSDDVQNLLIYRNKSGVREWAKVYEGDNLSSEFEWIDSLTLADTNYRYLMMAVDSAGNESKPTKPVSVKTLKNFEKKVPEPKVVYDKKRNCIVLTWVNTQTVANTLVYRKVNNGGFTLLDSATATQLSFEDFKVKKGDQYEYRLRERASDGGLSQFSKSITINL